MDSPGSTGALDDLQRVEMLRARAAAKYSLRAKPARLALAALIVAVFGSQIPRAAVIGWGALMVVDVAVGIVVVRRLLRRVEQSGVDRPWYRRLALGWSVSAVIQGALPVLGLAGHMDGYDLALLMTVGLAISAMVIVTAQGFGWLSLCGAGPILIGSAVGVARLPNAPHALLVVAAYAGYLAYLNTTIRQSATSLAEQTVRAERLNRELACERDRLVASRSSLEAANAQLTHAASHDVLTGLANRSLLTEAMARALGPTPREGDVAVLFADLDRFKAVNDVRGHAVGDELLRQVAERLRMLVRPGDVVARVGGDEFVVLMANCPLPAASAVAGRIEREIDRPFELSDGPASIGITIGISMARPGDDLDAVLVLADAAMYERKRRQPPTTGVHGKDAGTA